jgi:hypothetical protein
VFFIATEDVANNETVTSKDSDLISFLNKISAPFLVINVLVVFVDFA